MYGDLAHYDFCFLVPIYSVCQRFCHETTSRQFLNFLLNCQQNSIHVLLSNILVPIFRLFVTSFIAFLLAPTNLLILTSSVSRQIVLVAAAFMNRWHHQKHVTWEKLLVKLTHIRKMLSIFPYRLIRGPRRIVKFLLTMCLSRRIRRLGLSIHRKRKHDQTKMMQAKLKVFRKTRLDSKP